ncbi:hypothetical protein Hanom_Chr05g00411511 [Helianthus anomalus]
MWPVNMGMVAGFHTSQDSSSSRLDDQVLKNTSTSSSFDLGSSSRDIPMKPPSTSSSIINDQKTVNQSTFLILQWISLFFNNNNNNNVL